MTRLVTLAGGERELEDAMNRVTEGRGGRVDEKALVDYLVKRREAIRRITARHEAVATTE
jgi:hypothetical protein